MIDYTKLLKQNTSNLQSGNIGFTGTTTKSGADTTVYDSILRSNTASLSGNGLSPYSPNQDLTIQPTYTPVPAQTTPAVSTKLSADGFMMDEDLTSMYSSYDDYLNDRVNSNYAAKAAADKGMTIPEWQTYHQQEQNLNQIRMKAATEKAGVNAAESTLVRLQDQINSLASDNYGAGNINLSSTPAFNNKDGTRSYMTTVTYSDPQTGYQILIPGMAQNPDGTWQTLTYNDAVKQYLQTGKFFGVFQTAEQAQAYANELNNQQRDLFDRRAELSAQFKAGYDMYSNLNNTYKNGIGAQYKDASTAFNKAYDPVAYYLNELGPGANLSSIDNVIEGMDDLLKTMAAGSAEYNATKRQRDALVAGRMSFATDAELQKIYDAKPEYVRDEDAKQKANERLAQLVRWGIDPATDQEYQDLLMQGGMKDKNSEERIAAGQELQRRDAVKGVQEAKGTDAEKYLNAFAQYAATGEITAEARKLFAVEENPYANGPATSDAAVLSSMAMTLRRKLQESGMDKQRAANVVDALQREGNAIYQRKNDQFYTDLLYGGSGFGDAVLDHAIGALSVLENAVSGFGVLEGVRTLLGDQTNKVADPNSLWLTGTRSTNKIRGEINQMYGTEVEMLGQKFDLHDFGYNTVMSILDSRLGMIFPKGVMIGAGAAAQSLLESAEAGESIGNSFLLAVATGVNEGLWESISISGLERFREKAVITWKDVMTNLLKQGITNASEEFNTTLANAIFDYFTGSEKSNWSRSIAEYMTQINPRTGTTYTREQAKNQVMIDTGKQMLGDAFSGFIQGVAMGTTAQVAALADVNQFKSKYKLVNADIDTIYNMEYGLQFDVGSNTYALCRQAKTEWTAIHEMTDAAQQEEAMKKWLQTYGNSGSSSILNSMAVDVAQGYAPANYTEATHQAYVDAVQRGDSNPLHIESPLETKVRLAQEAAGMSVDAANKTRRIILDILAGRDGSDELGSIRYGNATAEMLTSQAFRDAVEAATGSKVFGNTAREVKQSLADIAKRISSQPAIIEDFTKTEAPESDLVEPTDIPPAQEPPRTAPQNWYNTNANAAAEVATKAPRTTPSGIPLDNLTRNNWYSNGGDSLARNGWYGQTQSGEATQPGPRTEPKAEPKSKPTGFEARVKEEGKPGEAGKSAVLTRSAWYSDGQTENKTPTAEATTPSGIPFSDLLRQRSGEEADTNAPSFELTRNAWYTGEQGEVYDEAKAKAEAEEARRKAQNLAPSGVPVSEIGKSWYNTTVPVEEAATAEAESEASTEPAAEQTTEEKQEAPAKEEAKTESEAPSAPKSEETEKEKPKQKQKPKNPIKRLTNYLVYGKEKADADEPSLEVVNKQEAAEKETGADEAPAPKKDKIEIGGQEVTEAEFVEKATAGGDITEETARDAFRRLANDEAIPNDIKESIAEEIEMDRARKGAKEQGVTEYQYLVQESLNMLLKSKGVSVKFVPRSELPGGNGMVDLTTGEILLSSTGATADTTKMEGIAWTLAHEILHVGEDAEKRAKRSPQEQAQIQTLTDKILGYKSGDEYVPGVLQRLAEIGAIQDKYADLANDPEKLSDYVKDLQNQYRSYYAAKNKGQAWLDKNITEDYAREELAGNVFGSLLGVNIFDSYAKDMTGHPFRRVDLLRTLAGIDETPLRAADMSLRERKLAKAIAEVSFGHNMRGKTFRQIYDTTQSEIRSLIRDVTAAVDSRKDAVFEALDDGDIADATRLSYVSLGEAAGFEPVEVDGVRTFVRRDGTPVGEKVTVDDIKASPIGALIAYAREKGYLGKNSQENADNADKQTQFFADVCTLAAKNNDFAMSMQFVGATTFTGIKANSDKQYGTTYDFKSVCIKTQACIDLMSAAMVAKKGGLSNEEILDLYREANEIGLPVPCPECYVWNRWVGIGGLLDNMWTYQERYGSMSFDEVKVAYDEMHDRVQAKAEEAGLSFGKAKTKMTSQLTKDYQNQLDKVAKKMNNGDRVSQADIDKLNALGDTMTDVKALTWIENVYFGGKPMTEQNISKNYRVPSDILFDLNRGAEFATKYANAWAFRTTQGAGYGKAITPYSQATLGEGIIGTNSISKMTKAKASGTLNNPFLNSEGELDKDAKKMLDNAVKKQKIQLFRGGQRFNSTSDASNDVASDYLLAMLEMQSMHGGVQVYTKVDGSVQYLSNVGAFINQSLMPLGSGLNKDGSLRDTTIGGMSPSAAFRNREEYENAGTITIGVNDAHIRELYKHRNRDFIIPYHVSGGNADMVAESRSIQDPQAGEDTRVHSSDYTRTQNEKVLSDEVLRNLGKDSAEIEQIKKNREARIAILTQGKPDMTVVRENPILSELYDKFNGGQWDGVKLPKGEVESHIYPNEFWDTSANYDSSGINTERYLQYCEDLGILHKFSGMVPSNGTLKTIKGYDQYGNRVPLTDLAYQYDENGNRSDEIEDYYWKNLVDRRMYGNQGQYLEQGAIDLTNLGADTIQNFAKYNTGRSYNQALAAQAAEVVRQRFTPTEDNTRMSLAVVDPVESTGGWKRGATFDEVKEKHPTLFELDADEADKRNPTQITGTVKTYRKIYDLLKREGFNGTILDASSGLGVGTEAGRNEYGFDVDDIEPFPDPSYNPRYTDYSTLNKQYDAIISNAVLNVIPQDLRDAMVVKIGELLAPGGRAFINVRGADVKNASSKVAIDEDGMEYFISDSGSYQKGFRKPELKAYLEDALGDGFTVELTNQFGGVAAIVTKNGGSENQRYSISVADQEPGRNYKMPDGYGAFIRNTAQHYVDRIFADNEAERKTVETRKDRTLDAFLHKRMPIIDTSKHQVIGDVYVEDVIQYDNPDDFNADYNRHWVPKTDKNFGWTDGEGTRYGYVLSDPQKYDTPIPLDEGYRKQGRIGAELPEVLRRMSLSNDQAAEENLAEIANNNYNKLLEVMNNEDSLRNEQRGITGSELERLRQIYSAESVTSARDRSIYCAAVRRAGAFERAEFKEGPEYLSTDVIRKEAYTREMLEIEKRNSSIGYETKFFLDDIVYDDGESRGVAGLADTDNMVAWVIANAINGQDRTVSYNGKKFGQFKETNPDTTLARHERIHLLRADKSSAAGKLADSLFNLIDQEKGPYAQVFDNINFWYQMHRPQYEYRFSDYSEEIAADLYAGSLLVDDKNARSAVQNIVAQIDEAIGGDKRYSISQNQGKAQYASREEQIQDIVRRLMDAPTDQHTLWNDSALSTERMPISKSQINNDSGFRQDREAVNFPKQSENKKVAMRTTQTLANSGLSDARAARMIEEATKDGVWDYIPESNDSATDWAKQEIDNKDWDGAYGDYLNSVNKGLSSKKLTALGIQLYNQAIQKQDYYAAMDVASLIIRNAHEAGSALQALNMLGKLNADGKLYMMMKGINNITDYYKKLYPNAKIRIDDALVKAYQKAVQSNDQEAINKAQADIERSVADQIPATWKDRLNNWRYFSMLANPTTHIRNVFGNLGFAPVRLMKQAMKAGLERVFMGEAGEGSNRTTALLNLAKADDRARLRAGLADAKNVMDLIQSGGKQTGPKDRIEAMRQIALTKVLDKVMKANTKALDAEDVLFSAPSYAEALASYLKARGISADDYTNNKISEEDKIAAQKHAIKEAQKATYRDHNAFSDAIANIGSRGRSKQAGVGDKVLTAATEAILPFKRTPANIMARAWEYSPAELVTIMFSDVGKLTRAGAELQAAQEESDGSLDALRRIQKAEAAVAEAKSNMFDHISSSAIGSVVLLLGMLARHRGWIMGADDDDDEQAKFDKLRGGQEYSLVDNAGNTYTIDWLAPEILPFFTGVALYDSLVDRKKGEGGILGDIKEVAMSLYEPMLNMSMLSSLNDMLANQKYVEDNEQISYLAKRVAASYISQFFPTFLGKVENITEDKKYTTYINKDSILGKDEQYNVANILNKIPGNNAEYNQIINYDAWGREQSTGNLPLRVFQNMISPGYYKANSSTPYDDELQRLKDLGFDKVLPYKVSQSQKVDEKYMTAEEYELFTKTMGETQYKLIGQLLKSSGYKRLSDKDKAEAVQEMYNVAKQTATNTVLKKRGGKNKEKIKLTSAEKAGMQPATYVIANTVYENAKTPQGYNTTTSGNTPTWAKMLAVIDDSSFSNAEKLTFVNAKSTKKEDFKSLDEARKYYEKDKADDKTKPNQKKK